MDSFNLTKLALLYYNYISSNNISYAKCMANQTSMNKRSFQKLCVTELKEFLTVYKYLKEQDEHAEVDLISFSLLLNHLKSTYNHTNNKISTNKTSKIMFLIVGLIVFTLFTIAMYLSVSLRYKYVTPANSTIIDEEVNCMGKRTRYTDTSISEKKPLTNCSTTASIESQTCSPISNLDFKTPALRDHALNNKKGLFFDMTSKQGIGIWKTHLKKFVDDESSKNCNMSYKHKTKSVTCSENNSSAEDHGNGNTINEPNKIDAKLCDLNGRPFKRIYIAELGLWMSRQKYVDLFS